MKQLYLRKIRSVILLASFFFTGCAQAPGANPIQKTIIRGGITNFEDPSELPALELFNFMPFISEWDLQSRYIKQDGAFQFEFVHLYPMDIMITFRELFSVYAHPGDSIFLSIDARMLFDTSNTIGYENKYIQIKCARQKFQDDYQDFMLAFNGEYNSEKSFLAQEEAQEELDHAEYTLYMQERSEIQYAFLKEYKQTHQPCAEFQKWVDNWIYLSEPQELLRYAWLHPMLNELDRTSFKLPGEYYRFLEDERLNDERLFASQKYAGFLHELYMHLYREFHQSELHSSFDTLFKAGDKTEAYRLNLNYIIDNSTGFEQEYFVARLLSRLIYWKLSDEFEALYDPSLVGRDDFNQILAKEYSDLQKLMAAPVFARDLNLHDSGVAADDLIFKFLPEKFPNKVIYVDFWAPWCGPCMAEMPHSKELQEKFKGKDVVFVFLASKCTEKSWKATIAQKQLSGEHFLLTDKEYALLAEKFNIAGIPRYMIIDKQGVVVKTDAPRPGDESLIEILENLFD